MGMVKNIIKYNRETAEKEDAELRVMHHREFYIPQTENAISNQASRCMDCGIAYCNHACPLGNVLPDLNALVADQKWEKALKMLHKTNNFPEFTGRLCPALCEASCTLSINEEATTTKEIELKIIEKGFEEGWVKPQYATIKSGRKVAVIGSGPAGLTVAQQLCRVGHHVTVYERSDEIGGILARGIPDYKLEKSIIERRVFQLKEEGIKFKTNSHVGIDITTAEIKSKYDAVCLCGGSSVPRDLNVEGRQLQGIHFAMDFLIQQNLINQNKKITSDSINAKDKHVVIIGGGDTGADCLGISIRQGAKQVSQLELMPKPPHSRNAQMPWPYWPMILRTNTAHEEGGNREWSIATKYFSGENGVVNKIHCIRLDWVNENNGMVMNEIPGSEFVIKADLVLFAMGFLHPDHLGMLESFDLEKDERGNVKAEMNQTNHSNIFTAGDMHTGQSLVCKAIADGRKAAVAIDKYLRNDL
ncbi:MAG: glutamate synthase subunit beta [Clostridiales bacterium]|nr:glutamate synthase subunit beta [Clostridiales bacterium]